MTDDLFAAAAAPDDVLRPLAVRMRPETLDEVVGQQHVLGEGSPLRRLADPQSQGSLTAPSSIIRLAPREWAKPRSPTSSPNNPGVPLRSFPP